MDPGHPRHRHKAFFFKKDVKFGLRGQFQPVVVVAQAHDVTCSTSLQGVLAAVMERERKVTLTQSSNRHVVQRQVHNVTGGVTMLL